MTVLVAVDLDHTVLFTRTEADGTLVETYADGLDELAAEAVLVPVTTRTPEQYLRTGLRAHLAVTANGAVLLRDGAPDPAWAVHVREVCAASAPLAEVAARVCVDAPWVRTHRVAADAFCYVVGHSRADIPRAWLAEIGPWLAERGWTLSVQGRKVYAVPAGLTKAAAIRRLRAEVGATRMLAAGDALLDAGLLEEADAAIRPAHGELHEQGWSCPGLTVTESSGPAAGAEIVAWLRARVTPEPARPTNA